MLSVDFEARMYCRCVGKGGFYPCSRSFVVQEQDERKVGREEKRRGVEAVGGEEEVVVEGRVSLVHVHPCFGARGGEVEVN